MYKHTQEPDVSAALDRLSNYTTDELKELLNDDEKFEELIKDNQQVIIFTTHFLKKTKTTICQD